MSLHLLLAIWHRSHLLDRARCTLWSAERARSLSLRLVPPAVGSRAVAGVEQASQSSGRRASFRAVVHGFTLRVNEESGRNLHQTLRTPPVAGEIVQQVWIWFEG